MRYSILFVSLLTGCAFNVANTPLAKFTHNDLQAAAFYANSNGYPARAAVYMAIDQQLTACENALTASAPKALPTNGGAFLAFEVAAEAVGSGIPAAVKINCEVVTIPSLLPIK